MSSIDQDIEELAEAIVFAHETDRTDPPPAEGRAAALERTAALAATAMAQVAVVPADLAARLAASGLHFCATRRPAAAPPAVRLQWSSVFAFACGAAASAAFLLLLTAGPRQASPAARRAALLAADAQVMRQQWRPGTSPLRGSVAGEVVWSTSRQEGYLTLRGLPPLDPERRYQLWILDSDRTGAPVDGGLFDVSTAADETVVPIRATLPVGHAAAFVVTVEDRKGVVVSEQKHVIAVAGL